jgi:magnesium transporter
MFRRHHQQNSRAQMSRRRNKRRKSHAPRIRRLTPPGTAPGTLKLPADAAQPSIQVIKYADGQFLEEPVEDVRCIGDLLDDQSVTWVNVSGLGDAEVLHALSDVFGLHGLAMEDVVNVHQRAKVEEYEDHLFIVLRVVSKNEHLESEQLSMFVGKNFVLTLQQLAGDCLNPVRERLRLSRGKIRQAGADYLAYTVIDTVVDTYFPIVDEYGERMERLDEQLSSGHSPQFMVELHEVRGDLMTLRRAIRPLRDALIHLMPDLHSLISESTQFYLRDCFDHTIQLMDLLDTYREMCSDLRDYYMSSINNRMNEVMKILTIIATIFIPLSFVAGVYGMNFNPQLPGNMPELNWPYGYVFALLLMGSVGLSLLAFIWRKGWLGIGDSMVDQPRPKNHDND